MVPSVDPRGIEPRSASTPASSSSRAWPVSIAGTVDGIRPRHLLARDPRSPTDVFSVSQLLWG